MDRDTGDGDPDCRGEVSSPWAGKPRPYNRANESVSP
jgi:hypothetical protein